MRRNDRKITDNKEIEKILTESHICRLGLSYENIPYVVPVNFGYKDNSLYIHCAPHGKKLSIIEKNPTVCFEIEKDVEVVSNREDACRCTTHYKSLIGMGKATILTEVVDKINALDVIMQQHQGEGNYKYKRKVLDMMSAIRIDITEISGKQAG